jgi:hypothetical protein
MSSVMPAPLRLRVDELAASFASDVLAAICAAPVGDLWAAASGGEPRKTTLAGAREPRAATPAPQAGPPRRGRAARLPRRSPDDIGRVVGQIVDLLRQNPGGLRAEQIRVALGLQAKELPRPLKDALRERRIAKSGRKRATTYSLKAGPGPKRAAARPAARKTTTTKAARPRPAKRGKRAGARKARPAPPPKRAAKRSKAAKATKSGSSAGERAEAARDETKETAAGS